MSHRDEYAEQRIVVTRWVTAVLAALVFVVVSTATSDAVLQSITGFFAGRLAQAVLSLKAWLNVVLPAWAAHLAIACVITPFVLLFSPLIARSSDRMFPAFRLDLFDPIRRPRSALDPARQATPFTAPAGSTVMQVRDAVLGFVHQGTALRRRGWLGRKAPETRLAWALLTEPPGNGKSRLGQEVARSLARRDRLGGEPSWSGRRLSLWSWLRGHLPRARADDGIPWDAGSIRDDSLEGDGLLWLPRRPTILLIDDPKPNFVSATLKRLARSAQHYRFPVRVLVISQVILPDFDDDADATRELGFHGWLPVLDQSSDFRQNIGRLRAFFMGLWGIETAPPHDLRRDDDFRRLREQTEASPLLIEIDVHLRLGRGKMKGDASSHPSAPMPETPATYRDRLLDHAAAPFLERLQLLKPSQEECHAIIVATLANGPRWEDWSRALGGRIPSFEKVLALFPYAEESRALERYRRDLQGSGSTERGPPVPTIRPDLIADRIVFRMLAEGGLESAKLAIPSLVAAAWRASLDGTMRTVLRRAAAESANDDPIATALQQRMPDRAVFASEHDHLVAVVTLAVRLAGRWTVRWRSSTGRRRPVLPRRCPSSAGSWRLAMPCSMWRSISASPSCAG